MFSDKIIIEGISYDCVKQGINEFNVKVSIAEAKNIFEIYGNQRDVPMSFNGLNSSCFILSIIKQEYSRGDGDNIILIRIG